MKNVLLSLVLCFLPQALFGQPSDCWHDGTKTEVVLPLGKGALISSNRWRDEVSYFHVWYNRGDRWLLDTSNPTDPIGGPHTYKPTHKGILDPVPNGQLKLRFAIRQKQGNVVECMTDRRVVELAERTSLRLWTGDVNKEPFNISVDVVCKPGPCYPTR